MMYIVASVVLILCIIVYLHFTSSVRAKDKIETIRIAWSQPKTGWFQFDSIGKLAALTKEKGFHQLTEQTIYDIDFYNLFRFIDRTTSKIGQQVLYKRMMQPLNSREALLSLDRDADFFTSNPRIREEIQLELQRLSESDAYYIVSLFQGKLLERPTWFKYLFLSNLMVFILLLMSFQFPVLLIFLIIPFALNMFVHYWNKNNTYPVYPILSTVKYSYPCCREIIRHRSCFQK